jgi:signal transduction histidine kinase
MGALGLWWAALLLAEGAGLEWGDVVFLGALTTSAWVPGVLAFRSRSAREVSAALSELRTEQAARAVTDERARIARELHDVVAHAVGIMVVQAGAAERVMGSSPLQAQRALRAVQDTGRTAVAELTRLLGLLRAEDADQLAPLPSVAGLTELCDRVTQAGVTVTVQIVGDLTALPPVVDLNVYRVVQEALTNAVKHAPGTHVQVCVQRSGPLIDVQVTDNGPHGAHVLDEGGSGLGLIGLRERVNVFGGQLDAGPEPNGGFRVAVRLPVTPAVP